MGASDIVSIICSILGVILAIVSVMITVFIYKRQTKLERDINQRDEKKYKLQIQSEARRFVQKYNESDEIQLLALCIIADKFNSSYPYKRQIYKDYCCLNDDVKIELLKIFHIDLKINELDENDFYRKTLKIAEHNINELYPDQPNIFKEYFNNDAEYFRTILNLKDEPEPDWSIAKQKTVLGIMDYKFKNCVTSVLAKDDLKVEFDDGNSFVPAEQKISDLFAIPTSEGTSYSSDLVHGYLLSLILEYSAVYNCREEKFENNGYYRDFFAFNGRTMEDVFLETLFEINNRSFDKRKTVKKEKSKNDIKVENK